MYIILSKLRCDNQFVNYVFLGFLLNVGLYSAFLLLTWFGVETKLAMTILYIAGILYSFKLNKDVIFKCEDNRVAFFKFIASVMLGYCLNYSSLYIFSDIYGYPYQYVQAVSVVFLAFLQFLINKYWVFSVKSQVVIR